MTNYAKIPLPRSPLFKIRDFCLKVILHGAIRNHYFCTEKVVLKVDPVYRVYAIVACTFFSQPQELPTPTRNFLFNLFALYRNPSPRPPFTPFLTQLSSPGAMSIREVWFVYQYLCLLRNALRWSINQRTSQLYGNGPVVQTISRTISRCSSDLNSNLRGIFFL